jgi:hypothetical protein
MGSIESAVKLAQPVAALTGMINMVASVLAFVGLPALLIGFGLERVESMPKNALLVVNFETGEYVSPPCTLERDYPGFIDVMTVAEVRELKLKPENKCRNGGGFSGTSNSIIRHYLFPKRPRWGEDGAWHW